MLDYGEHPLEHFGQLGFGIILLLWPLVVFAFYRKRNTLKNIIFFIHICFAIISVLRCWRICVDRVITAINSNTFLLCIRMACRLGYPPVFQKKETRMKKRNWNIFFRNLTLILSCIAAVAGFFLALEEVHREFHRNSTILFLLILGPAMGFAYVWVVYALVKGLYILFRWAWRSEVEEEKDEVEEEKEE